MHEIMIGFKNDKHLKETLKRTPKHAFLSMLDKADSVHIKQVEGRLHLYMYRNHIDDYLCSDLVWLGRWIEMAEVTVEREGGDHESN